MGSSSSAAVTPRPWRLFGALCLLRLPRITQPLRREEEEMAALMGQVRLGERRGEGSPGTARGCV